MLSDEGLELSQRQTDTMFQGPSLDDQAEELIIGITNNFLSYASPRDSCPWTGSILIAKKNRL